MARYNQQSKGCGTCRERKIRCDLGFPECQRCFTTGRRCTGYKQNYKFKVITGINRSRSRLLDSRHDGRRHRGAAEVLTTPHRSQLDLSHIPQPGACIKQTAIACDAFVGTFLNMLFPPGTDPRTWKAFPGGWICSLPTLFHSRGEPVNQGLLALYTGFIGRKQGDTTLINMSMELYTNALHSLRNSGICTKRKLSSDEADIALASILIFSRIELLTGEGSSGGYMTHIRGGLQLVKRLGERLPDSILTKTIVKKLRFLGFYDAVRHEQPYFMSRPPYNTIYLTHLGDADYLMHRIIEEAIELPNVLYEANNLDNLHYATQEQIRHGQLTAQHLLSRTAIVEDKVNQWLDMMASVTPYPKVIVTPSVDGAADYPQGLRIQFANCVSSCLWMFYWSLVVRLNRLIKQLHSLHSTLSAKLPDHPQLPASLINRIKDDSISDQYADNIGISLGTEITASTFHAQEALAFIFNLYAYWEERGNIEKTNWCIETLKMLESQGLSLYIQVNERQDKCAALTAAFLADRTKTLV